LVSAARSPRVRAVNTLQGANSHEDCVLIYALTRVNSKATAELRLRYSDATYLSAFTRGKGRSSSLSGAGDRSILGRDLQRSVFNIFRAQRALIRR
jgi:hypothetical protein